MRVAEPPSAPLPSPRRPSRPSLFGAVMSWILSLPLAIPFATAVLAFLLRRGGPGAGSRLRARPRSLPPPRSDGRGAGRRRRRRADGRLARALRHHPGGRPPGRRDGADHRDHRAGGRRLRAGRHRRGAPSARGYHALFNVLLAGVVGAFLTGDLFNLYVWFEVMLIASFGLLVLGGSRAAASTAGSNTSPSTWSRRSCS